MKKITEKNNIQDEKIARLDERYKSISNDVEYIKKTLEDQNKILHNHMTDFRKELNKIKIRIAYATGAVAIIVFVVEFIIKRYL